MPINFELTFTQLLLTQLDTGQAGGSKDVARFITDGYVRTMLTGLPGGGSVPPTLPAPGLGSPPPPFPLPSIPINNYTARQRAMQRILQTYFEAREVLIMQGDIKGTIQSITLLYKKLRTAQRQLNTLINKAIQIQRELLALPELLEEIKQALTLVIEAERQKLERLYLGLTGFQVSLGPVEFERIFAKELRLIETVRSFRVTANIGDYRALVTIVNQAAQMINMLPEDDGGDSQEAFKRRFYERIRETVQSIVNISNIFAAPGDYINYVNGLSNVDGKLRPVLNILYRYDFLEKKLRPQFIKLRRKIDELLDKISNKIKARIDEFKTKLRDKVKALAQRRQGPGQKSLFRQVGKQVSNLKNKYYKKIKKVKKTVRTVQRIVNNTQRLITDSIAFKQDIEVFFDTGLRDYIQRTVVDLQIAVTPEASAGAVRTQLEKIYRDIKLTNPIIREAINRQLVGKVTSPQVLLEYLASKPNDLMPLLDRFRSLALTLESIIVDVQSLKQKKQMSFRVDFGDPPVTRPTVADLILNTINKIEDGLAKVEKFIRTFVNEQNEKLQKAINRAKEEVEIKLISLVPLKSDLKDGKTKAEIIKLKRDKIKDTKNKIKKLIKKIAIISSKILPSTTIITRNASRKEWRYTTNQFAINNFINGVYDLKILETSNPGEARLLLDQKREKINLIRDYMLGFELLVDFFIAMAKEMESTDFIKRLGERLKQSTVQAYIDLYEKIKQIPRLSNASLPQIVDFLSDTYAFRALNSTFMRTMLADCERLYFRETRALFQQIGSNPLMLRIVPGLDQATDIMLVKAFDGIRVAFSKVGEILEKLYRNTAKPLVDKIQAKLQKVKQDINDWLREHVRKRAINLDLKLMTIAFNLATRAFWTGFSWTTPNGVRYTSTTIGPFLPLKTKPDDGASFLVREIARNLNTQLIQMVGLVTPPPPTGIPPFPFTGYR